MAVPPHPTPLPVGEREQAESVARQETISAILFSLRRLRLGARRALVETAIEHMLGDAVLEHLDRAARDHPAAAAPHAVFHQRLARIAERAHRLQRLIRNLE